MENKGFTGTSLDLHVTNPNPNTNANANPNLKGNSNCKS